MTTSNDLTNAANSLLTFIRARNTAIQNLETRFIALGQPAAASQPDALNNFNRLVVERDVESNIWNENVQYTSFIQLYNSAPESSKTDAVKALKNSVVGEANSLIELGRNQRATTIPTTRQAIQNALRGVKPDATIIQPRQPYNGGEEGGSLQTSSQTDPNGPGRRLKNPLGWFASYTYNLSLYMVSQDGYNTYLNNGRRFVPPIGSAIIAQSGGSPAERRPQNMPFDYYIDNLKIEQNISGKDTGTSTNLTNISFTITEPYGFSFITKLRDVSAGLNAQSTGGLNTVGATINPIKQFFIIGIRFYGYDDKGNIMRGDNEYDGMRLDPNWQGTTEGQAVFERFIDFTLKDFKFKIDGKATIYNISGAGAGTGEGAGVKRGALNTPLKVEAKTVGEAFSQLIKKLNADGQVLVENKQIKYRNNYKIFGLNDDGTVDRSQPLPEGLDALLTSSMVIPENQPKDRTSSSDAQNISEVNDKKSVSSVPNNTKHQQTINRDTPVLQAIQELIVNSSYIRDAMKKVYKAEIEVDDVRRTENYNKPDTQKRVRWYNVSPQVSEGKYDPNTGDYAFEILYIIRPYDTPVVNSAYSDKTPPYPGPHKRYDYWYTGKNSEIISYEQTFERAYFLIALDPAADSNQSATQNNQSSVVPGKETGMNTTGSQNQGLEAQNTYVTSLFDPKAYTDIKMTILGDPDYLMQTSESTEGLNEAYRKYYNNDGFTINPNGGQVFVEVDFKEAIDYNTDKGFMDINESILFYKYPPNLARKIKGVSYQVKTVHHSFQNGKFTQVLDMFINMFGESPPG